MYIYTKKTKYIFFIYLLVVVVVVVLRLVLSGLTLCVLVCRSHGWTLSLRSEHMVPG